MMQQIAAINTDIATSSPPVGDASKNSEGSVFSQFLEESKTTSLTSDNSNEELAAVDKVLSGDTSRPSSSSRTEKADTETPSTTENKGSSASPTNKAEGSNQQNGAAVSEDRTEQEGLTTVPQDNRDIGELIDDPEASSINYIDFVQEVQELNLLASNDQAVKVDKASAESSGDEEPLLITEKVKNLIQTQSVYSEFEQTSSKLTSELAIGNDKVSSKAEGITSDIIQSLALNSNYIDKDILNKLAISEQDLSTLKELLSDAIQNGQLLVQSSDKIFIGEQALADIDPALLDKIMPDLAKALKSVNGDNIQTLNQAVVTSQIVQPTLSSETADETNTSASLTESATTTQSTLQGLSEANIEKQAIAIDTTPEFINQTDNQVKQETPLNKPINSGTQTLIELANQSESEQLVSLNKIKQKLSEVIPDMQFDQLKGNEFIAALKAGLKEHKAKLAQGQEVNVELKALVFDSIEKSNLSLNPQQQIKIDQSLQQLFGIANNLALNPLQSTQVTGLSTAESISAEKMVQGMTDTNRATQQQASQSQLDKAVNIFKPDGQQQLAERVRWMINGRNSAAEIRLDPPELGTMQIRINMSGEAAAVSFVVQSQQAKEALDFASPRLREMLEQQGIELGQSSVQQDADQGDQQQQLAQNTNALGEPLLGTEHETIPGEAHAQAVTQRIAGSSIGGIDFYA